MPCNQPFRDDSAQTLLFKIAECIAAGGGGGGVAGVASFNGRTGVVTLTSGDVTTALGFTPISQADGDSRYVLKSGDTMTGSLNIANSAILVASDPALDITQTWNNAAVTFTGLQSNITNTASNSDSNLFNFQSDGIDRFRYAVVGQLFATRQDATNSGVTFFQRKRGNAGGATNAVAADATIGSLTHSGWDGTAYANGSRISGLASEAWTNVAHGSRIDIYTTPVGSVTEQISLRLEDTGQAKFLDGTAALPSITFQSDPDTGIYRIGANSLGFSAGGALIFDVAADGVNLTTALAYQYNSVNVIRAQTALNNYYFGPSGNLTSTGTNNTASGFEALISNTSGVSNNASGSGALRANTTGSSNVAFGHSALNANTTGSFNVAIGPSTLLLNTTGSFSVAVGYQALRVNTTGGLNTAVGYGALFTNTTGANNTALGYAALNVNTTGGSNVGVGYQALAGNTTGTQNTAIGADALLVNTTGTQNVAAGYESLRNTTTGALNTSLGYQSLRSNTTASTNVGVGYAALFSTSTSPNNTSVGAQSLQDLTTAATGQNVAVGYNTGRGITTGSNNTILGANVTGLAAALSNNIILADGAGVIRLQIDSSGNTTLAGTVATAAGTAALPAHTFSADLNTGLYNIGADSLGLSTGGTLRITTNTTDLLLATAFRLAMASGANQRAGNAVLVGGTVTVANTSVTANTVVMLTRKTSGGTLGTAITYTVTAATDFTITSDSALDTSTFSYLLIEVP